MTFSKPVSRNKVLIRTKAIILSITGLLLQERTIQMISDIKNIHLEFLEDLIRLVKLSTLLLKLSSPLFEKKALKWQSKTLKISRS